MEIDNLRVGDKALFAFSHEYEGNEFFHYERATFHGWDKRSTVLRAQFEDDDLFDWEAYRIDGKWFRADSVEEFPGESVESVRLVEVL
jgi:hypothetical protein